MESFINKLRSKLHTARVLSEVVGCYVRSCVTNVIAVYKMDCDTVKSIRIDINAEIMVEDEENEHETATL